MKKLCITAALVIFVVLSLTSCLTLQANTTENSGTIEITNKSDDVYLYAVFTDATGDTAKFRELGPHKMVTAYVTRQNDKYEVRYVKRLTAEMSYLFLNSNSSTITKDQTGYWSKETGNISIGDVIKININ